MKSIAIYIYTTALMMLAAVTVMAQRNTVSVGVMLPLNTSEEGIKMVEYYRGVLMACDSLRQEGTSINIRAWNVSQDTDIDSILTEETPDDLDLIIGPIYSGHIGKVAAFAQRRGTKLLLPLYTDLKGATENSAVYQAEMDTDDYNNSIVGKYLERFDTCHTVIIDCMDELSDKAPFTKKLRESLTEKNRPYSITSMKSTEEDFLNAFKRNSTNVVVLNTQRSQYLNIVCAKLNSIKVLMNDTINIRMFGHSEWFDNTSQYLTDFYKFDTYIPSTFFLNPLSPRTARMNLKYRWNFHADMLESSLPRFAILGFDQAYFFIKGLRMYGKNFSGRHTAVGYDAVQTPLNFEKTNEGYNRNTIFMLIHYTPNFEIETYTY